MNNDQLDKKIYILGRFRIQYYEYYESFEDKKNCGKACLPELSPNFLDLIKLILGWVFSNLSWELLKIVIEKFKKNKKEDVHIREIISEDKNLLKFVEAIKKSLEPIESIDVDLRSLIIEEMAVDLMVDEKIKIKKHSRIIKLLSESSKKAKKKLNVSFSDEDILKLKDFFDNYLKE